MGAYVLFSLGVRVVSPYPSSSAYYIRSARVTLMMRVRSPA
jgi:hypothetical protein